MDGGVVFYKHFLLPLKGVLIHLKLLSQCGLLKKSGMLKSAP